MLFGAVASATELILLATSVYILPLRHPIITARSVVTLDRISGGRVTLGAGVGWLEPEFEAVGEDFHTRGRRTDEIIEVLHKLWSEDVIEHRGEFFDFGPVKFQPKPLQKPSIPIEIGGSSPAALRRAGQLGDGWVDAGTHDLDELDGRIKTIQGIRHEAGRESGPFEITTGLGRTRAEMRRCEDIGVTRIVLGPSADQSGVRRDRVTLEDAEEWIKRFADEVIAGM